MSERLPGDEEFLGEEVAMGEDADTFLGERGERAPAMLGERHDEEHGSPPEAGPM